MFYLFALFHSVVEAAFFTFKQSKIYFEMELGIFYSKKERCYWFLVVIRVLLKWAFGNYH